MKIQGCIMQVTRDFVGDKISLGIATPDSPRMTIIEGLSIQSIFDALGEDSEILGRHVILTIKAVE